MDQNNKRRASRVEFNHPGRIRAPTILEANVQFLYISERGAAVLYSAPISVGAKIELIFQLDIGESRKWFFVQGEVRYHSLQGELHVVGVEFTRSMPGMAEAIRRLVGRTNRGDA